MINPDTGLEEAPITLTALVDANDIVRGCENNDHRLLVFIMQVVEAAGSVELAQRLVDRLMEEHGVTGPSS